MARFKPGVSGNPAGKPRGAVNKTTKLRRSIEKDLPDILSALTTQAKEGDTTAAKLLLDRVMPSLRPVDAPVKLTLSDDLTGNGNAIIQALGAGDLPVNQGSQLLAALGALARVVETDELIKRIEKLEQARDE